MLEEQKTQGEKYQLNPDEKQQKKNNSNSQFPEDLIESAKYQFRKLIKDEVPPLTNMIDLDIYDEEDIDEQTKKFKGYVSNNLLTYKLRCFEYTLYSINIDEKDNFLKNNQAAVEFPEKNLVENYVQYYLFKQIDTEQFVYKDNMEKKIEELKKGI